MSISRRCLDQLSVEFFHGSKSWKELQKKETQLRWEIKKLVSGDYDERLLEFPEVAREVCFNFGPTMDKELGFSRPKVHASVNPPSIFFHGLRSESRYEISPDSRCMIYKINDEDLRNKLNPLYESYLTVYFEEQEAIKSWNRIINRRTSLVMLKKKFPAIYERLKNIS